MTFGLEIDFTTTSAEQKRHLSTQTIGNKLDVHQARARNEITPAAGAKNNNESWQLAPTDE
jgi:hypothetical protein